MPKLDLRELVPQETLTITVKDWEGQEEEWVIPPFDNQTEHAYREWNFQLHEARKKEQLAKMDFKQPSEETKDEDSTEDLRTVGEVIAPMLVMVVKNVNLDADDLVKRFPGRILQEVSDVVGSFFFAHTLPKKYQEEKKEAEPPA